MTKLANYLFTFSAVFALQCSQQLAAQSVNDIKEYCQSMTGSGMTEEDLQSFMNDCIAEQSSYLEQDIQTEHYEDNSYESSYENSYDSAYEEPSYEQEPQYEEDFGQDQRCYAKVDEHIQKILDTDPNTDFDYDQLIDQCLNGKF